VVGLKTNSCLKPSVFQSQKSPHACLCLSRLWAKRACMLQNVNLFKNHQYMLCIRCTKITCLHRDRERNSLLFPCHAQNNHLVTTIPIIPCHAQNARNQWAGGAKRSVSPKTLVRSTVFNTGKNIVVF
jgi:hypothetical protein